MITNNISIIVLFEDKGGIIIKLKKVFKGIIISAALMIFATACSNQSKESIQKSDTQQEETEYYQDLSKSDRQKIDFTFKAVEDDSTDSSGTSYIVDTTVKNNGTKNIKLSLSKFFMMNPYDEETKVTSSQKQTITLKSGQKKTIKQMFENVSKDVIDGQGAYYYLNKNYRLAYFYDSTSDKGATSDNLSDSAAKKFNKKKADNDSQASTTEESTTNNNSSTTTNNTNQQSTQQASSASNNVINTSSQAIGLFKHMWGMSSDRGGIIAEPVNGGFYVHTDDSPDANMGTTILYDGSAVNSDGTTTPYSTLSQPLNNPSQPNAFDPSKY